MDMETQDVLNENRSEGIFQLIHGIFQDARSLFSKELLAARLETKQEIANAVKASIFLAIGAFVLGIGVVLLSLTVVFLLVRYGDLPLWSSLGIVGAVFLAAGAAVMVAGKKRSADMNPMPRDTLRSAKEDVHHIRQKLAGY